MQFAGYSVCLLGNVVSDQATWVFSWKEDRVTGSILLNTVDVLIKSDAKPESQLRAFELVLCTSLSSND
jgi:hypothetical protein